MSKRNRKNNPKKLLSIIIPVHRRFDLLGECLDRIPEAASNLDYEIIIVDNGSPVEDKKAFYSQRKEEFTLIENKTNTGFPKACNQGANKSSAPLLFFLNDDVMLDPQSLFNAVLDLDDPRNAIVGFKLRFPTKTVSGIGQNTRPPGKLQHVGLSVNIQGRIHHPFVGWDANHPKENAVRDVWGVTGAAFLVRTMLYRKLGGFDLMYGLGTYEDADMCMGIREMGYNIVVNQQATGEHFTGATAESYNIGYPLQENYIKFLSKWGAKLKWTDWMIL